MKNHEIEGMIVRKEGIIVDITDTGVIQIAAVRKQLSRPVRDGWIEITRSWKASTTRSPVP